jgi:hypothetical protein
MTTTAEISPEERERRRAKNRRTLERAMDARTTMIIYLKHVSPSTLAENLREVGDTDRRQHPVPHVGDWVMVGGKRMRVVHVVFDYASNDVVVEYGPELTL